MRKENENQEIREESKENLVLTIIEAYYAQPVPVETSSHQFKLPEELRAIEFHCPVIDF